MIQDRDDELRTLQMEVRKARRTAFGAVGLAVLLMVLGFTTQNPEEPKEVLRLRRLIIVDEAGRDRIVLGSPVPDPMEGRRASASTGMVIHDADGSERFGLGVKGDGSVSMGFDAPASVGDPRNRERLNMWVSPKGHATIRLLDNQTRAKIFIYVDAEERAWLDFPEWSDQRVVSHKRIGFGSQP